MGLAAKRMSDRPSTLLRRLVVAVDRWQRSRLDIWEFTDDPKCITRVGRTTTRVGAELSDGTIIHAGDRIGVIHFWNDRVPPIPPEGATLAWVREFMDRLTYSFRLLARYAAHSSRLAEIDAFGGELPLPYTPATMRLLERIGLEVFDPVPPRGLTDRVIDLGARAWTWLLRYAFNPESVRGLGLKDFTRRPTWISRAKLIRLYAPEELEGAIGLAEEELAA
jgi:hypothetical protein